MGRNNIIFQTNLQNSKNREEIMADFWLKVDKTLRYHGRQITRAIRGIRWDLTQPMAEQPIFIVGCSRAGTTLVYKTFSESREIGTLQRETHDFWAELHPLSERNYDTHALAAEDASDKDKAEVSKYFYRFTGKLRFVDKNNQNGLCVPYLLALFPKAHFVYIKRSPGDNINSLIEGWGKSDEFATWSDDLPADVNVENGKYKRWCFFVMKGWRKLINASVEEVCAEQYIAINEAILAGKELVPKDQWTEIFYEDLLKDPVSGFHNAFQSSGLQFTPELQAHCENVLSKPYNAFSEIRLDKWKDGKNREKIEKVMPKVTEIASRMGYNV